VPELQHHVDIIKQLGVEAMSDDKLEPDTSRSYRVLTPVWRSTELTDFLHVIDSVYFALRSKDTSKQRGSWPRHRIYDPRNVKFSQRPSTLRSLPRNAYSQTYLQRIQNPDLSLNPSDPYPFNHAPRIFQYVLLPISNLRPP
jgi:hypothetical protein